MPNNARDEERQLAYDVVNAMAGSSVHMSIAVLSKLLEALVVGAAPTKELALVTFNDIAMSLKGDMEREDPNRFGYLLDNENGIDPALFNGMVH